MSFSNLESKIEQAAKIVHDNALTGYASRTGLDSAEKTLPGVLFHAEKGAERPLNSGNYQCKLTIVVMDSADTKTLDNHRDGAAKVFDLFLDDAIATTLSSAIDDFTVLLVSARDGSATRTEDRQWVSEISLGLYACAATLV